MMGVKTVRFYDEYALKIEGLRRLKRNFVSKGQNVNGIKLKEFYFREYTQPMLFLCPEDQNALNKILHYCNKFGIGITFTDLEDYQDLPLLKKPVQKPFVLVNPKKLNKIVT